MAARVAYTTGERMADNPTVHIRLSEAEAEVHSARLIMGNDVQEAVARAKRVEMPELREQILKDFDLSYEEIESGLVGAGGDEGIDGIYSFANGQLIEDDSETSVSVAVGAGRAMVSGSKRMCAPPSSTIISTG